MAITLPCVFCNHPYEDLNHIFTNCPHTKNSINQINPNSFKIIENIPSNWNIHQILKLICESLQKKKIEELTFLWWCIWYQRNIKIFKKQEEEEIKDIKDFFKRQVVNWKNALKSEDSNPSPNHKNEKKLSRRK